MTRATLEVQHATTLDSHEIGGHPRDHDSTQVSLTRGKG
jgi:hypothetical protein